MENKQQLEKCDFCCFYFEKKNIGTCNICEAREKCLRTKLMRLCDKCFFLHYQFHQEADGKMCPIDAQLIKTENGVATELELISQDPSIGIL